MWKVWSANRSAYTRGMRPLLLFTVRGALAALLASALAASVLAESAAGLTWTMPAGWKAEAARPMRAATYTVPPAPGDKDAGECGIFFFGAGQGGSVQDNIDRWRAQMQGPDGKPAPAKVATRQARGLRMTTIDASGAYSGMGGPMGGGRAVPGYRLLGAVVEGSGGNVFVKFTGPARL